MPLGISTHLFLPQRLTTALLDTLASTGATQIELFASRHHFDYTDRSALRDLAAWFRSNPIGASLHMPLFTPEDEAHWSKHTSPTLNLISPAKADRILAMDEVKRALEAAEQLPLKTCVLHLGLSEDTWNTRTLDDSLTALEHLNAFAAPLGVQLLLENLTNNVATPDHLVEIVTTGHFDNIGFCLDTGHAHLAPAVPETRDAPAQSAIDQAFQTFAGKLVELHVHDNHGARDEHLWPGEGTIDWPALIRQLRPTHHAILEISFDLGHDPKAAAAKARQALSLFNITG